MCKGEFGELNAKLDRMDGTLGTSMLFSRLSRLAGVLVPPHQRGEVIFVRNPQVYSRSPGL